MLAAYDLLAELHILCIITFIILNELLGWLWWFDYHSFLWEIVHWNREQLLNIDCRHLFRKWSLRGHNIPHLDNIREVTVLDSLRVVGWEEPSKIPLHKGLLRFIVFLRFLQSIKQLIRLVDTRLRQCRYSKCTLRFLIRLWEILSDNLARLILLYSWRCSNIRMVSECDSAVLLCLTLSILYQPDILKCLCFALKLLWDSDCLRLRREGRHWASAFI